MSTLRELGEWALIEILRERYGRTPTLALGIGDDAAVGRISPGFQALTTVDLLVEGVHFRTQTGDPASLGWKALAVNLSDIAAMGGIARWAVVGLALPGSLEVDWLLSFYDGLAELADRHGVAIAGGDTVRSPGPIVVSITLVGEVEQPLLRSSARPGDRVFLTGPGGMAAAGLWCMENPDRVAASALDRGDLDDVLAAQRRPVPQLEAGRAIRETGLRVALLDNSDGLARSARLLAAAGGVDLRLNPLALPLTGATRAVAALAAVDPVHWALVGGEDYHLVGTVAAADWPVLAAALAAVRIPLHAVGEVLPGSGRAWVGGPDQQPQELTGESGFEHFSTSPDRP